MKNPFVIFNIVPTFEIDLSALTNRYRALVRAHHPDTVSSSRRRGSIYDGHVIDPHLREDDTTAEAINAAHLILKSPLKRAKALLELQGVRVDEEQTLKDPEILEEMFALKMSDDQNLTDLKRQEALVAFNDAFLKKDSGAMLKAYWRLRYLP